MRAPDPASRPPLATPRTRPERSLHILFAVHDWGLGHATRDLAPIRALLEHGHRVSVLSCGRALSVLRAELGGACTFHALRDIPKPLSRWPALFYLRMSLAMPQVWLTFRRERAFVRRLHREHGFDRIVSDSRFGVCLPEVPSFFLFHSLRQIIPGRPYRLERLVEASQRRLTRHARAVLVPDRERDDLAGDLCHRMSCDWGERVRYIGPLASVHPHPAERDLDCFISISGAEPQRSLFEAIVLRQVTRLPGRVVVALGRPDRAGAQEALAGGRISVHAYLDRHAQQAMFDRARLVVCRSGYSTIMELAQWRVPALFVPTPGQSEQEYLAAYHRDLGHTHAVRQSELDLPRDVEVARTLPGLPAVTTGECSGRGLVEVVTRPVPQFAP